jgi:aerobic C4-dicarboxylate transport protein
MSEARSITNFIGNGVATIWLSNNENALDREQMERAFSRTPALEDVREDNQTILPTRED